MSQLCVSSKRLLIVIACVCSALVSQAQEIDTLRYFAFNNEVLFWQLISNYYPLSRDQIDRYSDALSFYHLSSNENIHWTDELIETYEDKWSKKSILGNSSIAWDEKRILKFYHKDWFKWSYLKIDEHLFLSNFTYLKYKYEIDKEFNLNFSNEGVYLNREHFAENNSSVLLRDYIRNYEKEGLKNGFDNFYTYLDSTIYSIPKELLIKNAGFCYPWIFDGVLDTLSWKDFINLYSNIGEDFFLFPKILIYNSLVGPFIDDDFLESVYSNQIGRLKFYHFSREDQFGLVPTVNVHPSESCSARYLWNLSRKEFDISVIIPCNI